MCLLLPFVGFSLLLCMSPPSCLPCSDPNPSLCLVTGMGQRLDNITVSLLAKIVLLCGIVILHYRQLGNGTFYGDDDEVCRGVILSDRLDRP